MFKIIPLLISIFLISACSQKPYKANFNVSNIGGAMPVKNKPDKLPTIIKTNNMKAALKEYQSDNFVVLGKSEFSGPMQENDTARSYGREIGASHILITAKFKEKGEKRRFAMLPPTEGVKNGKVFVPDTLAPSTTVVAEEIDIFDHEAVYLTKLD